MSARVAVVALALQWLLACATAQATAPHYASQEQGRAVVAERDDYIVRMSALERMLKEALTAIRRAQLSRPQAQRLQWNRVLLHVRPPLPFTRAELQVLAGRIAAETEGLGLQKTEPVGDVNGDGLADVGIMEGGSVPTDEFLMFGSVGRVTSACRPWSVVG